ncbi:MAG: OmpH family outer membrane protein [Chitinophagaceae bacterium]|nr:OmpH family outer membrane protein [Chitinophagaceae bacterium]
MKQFSLVLNILLVAAVATLYYLHFSGNKKNNPTSSSAITNSPSKDSCAIGHIMAFVELDSLYDNVAYIKQKQKELENEQEQLARQYQNEYAQLENEKNTFLKRGNAITQQEAEEFQAKLYQKQQKIEADKQGQAQTMAASRTRTMDKIQSNLRTFLDEYNKDRRYSYIFATGTGLDYILYKDSAHNITADVIKGLTKQFEQKGN